jgi:hypothetical protein
MPDDRSNQTDYLYRLGGVFLMPPPLATVRTGRLGRGRGVLDDAQPAVPGRDSRQRAPQGAGRDHALGCMRLTPIAEHSCALGLLGQAGGQGPSPARAYSPAFSWSAAARPLTWRPRLPWRRLVVLLSTRQEPVCHCRTGLGCRKPVCTLGSPVAAGQRTAMLDGFHVRAAVVGAQPAQRDHVHSDDHQSPERVRRDEEHLIDGSARAPLPRSSEPAGYPRSARRPCFNAPRRRVCT